MRARLAVAAAGVALAAAAGRAGAFSDPALFAEPAVAGGGDGRRFTGSPFDGHACSVCHAPAAAPGRQPQVEVVGLPEEFEPGRRYSFVLRWTPADASYAAQLELVDADGAHPDVAVAAPAALPAASRCGGVLAGEPAVTAVDVGTRRVIGVADCGASEARVTFTAPDAPSLWFAAAFVRGDRRGDPHNDGVLALRRELRRVGDPATGGCAAGGDGGALALALVLAARLARRRRLPACPSPRRATLPPRAAPRARPDDPTSPQELP